MIDINDFLEEFTEEQKQDFYSFYDAINEYFGGNQADFFYMPDGYDAWFIREVIFPEREKIFKESIVELYNNPDSLLPELVSQLSDDALSRLNEFYARSDVPSIKSFNATVNSIFVESIFRSRYQRSHLKVIDPNYLVPELLKNTEKFAAYLDRYNELMYEDESPTFLELYKFNEFFKNLTTILSE